MGFNSAFEGLKKVTNFQKTTKRRILFRSAINRIQILVDMK